jgi:tetratricopeptide (TPR) repeat protein
MGRTAQLPPDPLGGAIPRAQIMLYLGRPADAWLATNPAQLYATIGWEDGRARCLLLRAEVASRIGERSAAAEALDSAARWALHSGSVEHLCLYHLVRSRIAIDEGAHQAARFALDEGLLLARQSGLWLYHVELFCLQAALLMKDSDAVAAERSARAAVKIASAAECQFQWGAARAGHLLGRSLAAQDRRAEARPVLEVVLSLRRRIGDPRAIQTEALLSEVSG